MLPLPRHICYVQCRVFWYTGRWLRTCNPLHVVKLQNPKKELQKKPQIVPNVSLQSRFKTRKKNLTDVGKKYLLLSSACVVWRVCSR